MPFDVQAATIPDALWRRVRPLLPPEPPKRRSKKSLNPVPPKWNVAPVEQRY